MATVLVVDDAAFLRALLKEILEKDGHTVVSEASNGKEAIEKFKAFRPEVIMMDVHMPEMDGMKALQEIIRIDSNAKVIICTSMGQKNQIIDAISIGAKDYILKPFHGVRVLEAVERILPSTSPPLGKFRRT